jgi:integrase
MRLLTQLEDDLLRIRNGLKPESRVTPILLSEFIPLYLRERERSRRSKNTLQADRFAFKAFLEYLGDRSLESITPKMVRDVRDYRFKVNRPATVNLALRHIKGAFQWALQESEKKYLMENPFTQKRLLIRDDEERVPRCLTPSEKAALFSAIDRPGLKRLYQFILLTGCRRNEALDLSWDDLNLEHHQVIFRKTKSKKSRIVPISIELMQVIAALDRTQKKPFPFQPANASHLFKTYARKAGLKEDIHLHCLRHTAASDLVRAGVHPMQIQKLLGHSSLEITEVYVHVLPEDLRDAAEMLTCLG